MPNLVTLHQTALARILDSSSNYSSLVRITTWLHH